MWAEFYSLSEDKGLTFEISQMSLCGDILRVELIRPAGNKDQKEEWCFVTINGDGDYVAGTRAWSDFAVADKRFTQWKRISREKAWHLRGLEHQ